MVDGMDGDAISTWVEMVSEHREITPLPAKKKTNGFCSLGKE